MVARQLVYRSRNVAVYYKPDRRSIARCAVGPDIHEAVHGIVEHLAKPYAISISPRVTNAYADSFTVDTTYAAYGKDELMTRVVARLVNTDPGAAAIEWGKHGKNAHHVLGQTLSMLDAARSSSDVGAEAAHLAATAHP